MKALFITSDDLKRYSIVDGNVDPTKYKQFVEIAQDIHVQNFLGTDLYDKIQGLIIAGTLDDVGNADYKTLLVSYVKPMHIHWSLVEFMPFAAYQIKNGGVYKHTSENAETVTKDEVDYLQEKQRNTADYYTRRLIDYLCNNSSLYPEYNTNSNGDIYPDYKSNFGGWVL